MLTDLLEIIIGIATISAGVMAGVYFSFSGFIMRSLNELGPAAATEAMNSINRVILKSWFMPLFFGSTILYVIIVFLALFSSSVPGRWILVVAGMVYIVGMFGCTAALNVPLNNRLAKQNSGGGAPETWNHYYRIWTRWNSLRTFASVVSTILGFYYLTGYA